MKKKGFTLIELLAVIVILAVIAILVTPMITSTINSAKASSLKASAQNIVSASEEYCARKLVTDSTFYSHSYQVDESTANEVGFTYNTEISGTLAIYSDCSVALAITDGTSQAIKEKTSESIATAPKETNFDDTAKSLVILTPESCFTTADSGLGDGTIKITDYTCKDPDIIIPGTIGGKTVVAIGDSAFEEKYFSYISDNSNIKKLNSNYNSSGVMRKPYYSDVIVRPSEIAKHDPTQYIIEPGDITSVDLSHVTELKTIGTYAFYYNRISSLDLSNLSKLTTIGSGAFDGNKLSTIELNNLPSLTKIGKYAFVGRTTKSVTLKDLSALVTIDNAAFARGKGTYPDSNDNKISYNTCSPTYTFDNVPNVAAYNSTDRTGLNPTAFGVYASECGDTITTTVCDGETAPTVIIKNTVSSQLQGDFYKHVITYSC